MKHLTSVFLISLVGAIASQEISSAQTLTENHYFVKTLLTPVENSAHHANIDLYKGKMWAKTTHDLNSNNLLLTENSISGNGHWARLRQPKGMGTQNSELRTQNSPLPTQNSELRTQDSGLILSPASGTVLDLPATTIVLQYPTGSQIQLFVNGKPVDPSLIGRTETDPNTGTTTQTWYGVPLTEGENIIEARQAGGEQDSSIPATKISIFVRGIPAQLKIQTLEARIPADSRSTATVTGQVLDSAGNPTNRDATITLATSSGKFISPDADPDQPGYQVKTSTGEFSATLQSSLQAGIVRIRAATPNINAPADIPNPQLEAFTQIEFETNLRPSLLTGVIDFRFGRRGTDFWDSFSNFLPADGDNNYQLNARGAAFTTGTLGNWLFTGAYNSSRNLNDTCNGFDRRLFQDLQFYEQQYPTYGDNCSRETVAPSRDSVYLRFEHSPLIEGAQPDYFMWGDYALSEFSTPSQQFTGITRSLHGFKGNYNLGNLQITGFYSQDVEGFQRDSIIPDGTSGFYFLSRRLVIPGSEDVFLEVEELDRPGTVLYRQQLTRSTDYEIDYDRGTLLFRRPILRVNADPTGTILVRRIISTYQYDSQDSSTSILGSHLQYNISRDFNRPSWIGATYLREDRGARDFELYGTDILLSFGNNSRLVGEYAHSRNDSDILGNVSGSAYRLELNGGIGRRGERRVEEGEQPFQCRR